MVGRDMLAAPITTANATSRAVYLPALPGGASWRHFFTAQGVKYARRFANFSRMKRIICQDRLGRDAGKPHRKGLFWEFSLCLSQACLGKMIIYI